MRMTCHAGFILSLALLVSVAAAEVSIPAPVPNAKDRCGVCGRFVTMYHEWVASIVFKEGTTLFFDGPKDMFKYLVNPGAYTKGRKSSDIQGVWVTEYYSARPTRAEGLCFVAGSDVIGPMGSDLVPMAGADKAETFRVDHQGKSILRFTEVMVDVLIKAGSLV